MKDEYKFPDLTTQAGLTSFEVGKELEEIRDLLNQLVKNTSAIAQVLNKR